MAISKKSKVLAMALCLTLLVCAMPLMVLAEVSTQNPIEISTITFTDDGDLLDVLVNYNVLDGVGDQITILAYVGDTLDITGNTNIVYIDQVGKPASADDRNFTFKVDKEKFESNNIMTVKVGGTGIETPGSGAQQTPGTPSNPIAEDKISVSLIGAYGITGGRSVTIDNAGNIVDPTLKNVKIGNTTLYYNEARNKFVGIVRSEFTIDDVVVSDGVSETLTYGRVNADEDINTLDAGNIINIYLGNVTGTDKQLLAADVNGDGVVNTLDAGSIINKYLGNISKFLIENN